LTAVVAGGLELETILASQEASGIEPDPDVDPTASASRSVGTLFEPIRSKRAG